MAESGPSSVPYTKPDTLISKDDGQAYWEKTSADVNGMLGGYPYISKVDLQGSRNFLAKLGIGSKDGLRTVSTALEGGAGIGRITRGLLLDISEQVDVVEPVAKFTDELRGVSGVRRVLNIGLEEWDPAAKSSSSSVSGEATKGNDASATEKYDLVWAQWCVGHLTDEQLVRFLRRCAGALRDENAVIVVKENVSTGGNDLFDEQDSSVTRRHEKFMYLFREAELKVVKTEVQRGFPKELFPVRIYALRP